MSTANNFDTLRRKVMIAYHQDGILDLAAAVVLLGFGSDMLTGNIVFLTLGWVGFPLYFILKQRITTPRFGFVQFVPRNKRLAQSWIMLGVGVLVVFAIFVGNIALSNTTTDPELQRWLHQYHMVPLSGMLFGLPALIAAFLLGVRRFYLYALLTVGLPALAAWLNWETYIPILGLGLVMLVYGIWLLTNFMRQYRLDPEAGSNVNGY